MPPASCCTLVPIHHLTSSAADLPFVPLGTQTASHPGPFAWRLTGKLAGAVLATNPPATALRTGHMTTCMSRFKRSMRGRRQAAVILMVVGTVGLAVPARAHPLGNFTTNTYTELRFEKGSLTVDLIVDLAEIPTAQQRVAVDSDSDDRISSSEAEGFAASTCPDLATGLHLTSDSAPLNLHVVDATLAFPPGEGGLDTMRLECRLQATIPSQGTIAFEDANYPDRSGWREAVVSGTDTLVSTDLPTSSATGRLTSYPDERLSSPVRVRSGEVDYRAHPGATIGGDTRVLGRSAARATADPLADLIDRRGALAVTVAMVTALGLGVVHALAPGHGKTIMAAYLVGTRGTVRQAAALGGVVAVSHTVGVFVLGGVVLAFSSTFAPERVLPYLSAVSGSIVMGIGMWLLIGWLLRIRSHGHHDDVHGHRHDHHEAPDHDHARHHSLNTSGRPGWKVLGALGLSGGMVPSTSAVVLMLAAINFGRIGFGIALIALFGTGMALTLIAVGLGLVLTRDRTMRRNTPHVWMERLRPLVTPAAGFVVLSVGTVLTVRAVTALL